MMNVNPKNLGDFCDICGSKLPNKTNIRFSPHEGHSEKYFICYPCWESVKGHLRSKMMHQVGWQPNDQEPL